MDVDACLESIKACKYLPENDMRQLCNKLKEILAEESTVVPVRAPVTLCGDIHGQYYDLVKLFEVGGDVPDTSYIFMGDFVDRGRYSLETLTLLLLLKVKYPDRITLTRGNHESRNVTRVYGFYDECLAKYQSSKVWEWCCTVFDYLPLAALIDGSIFCVHGGLSPELPSVDSIRTLFRMQELPQTGGPCDLLWSDPEAQIDSWAISPRGGGYLFGHIPTDAFCHNNGVNLIVRSHQLVDEGYNYPFAEKNLVTLWSAPNYCYRCGNKAAILKVPDDRTEIVESDYRIFLENDVQGDATLAAAPGSQYFL
ncbi:serine/threonine-protein phosphatase PP-X isozyme 2 [Radiomyces spectabilis]|uniref:serine/threonine-protein phosphatase PP-X isozyme 2 n=1 Tax=Radiomyces spectabilis TaxID=64574 RepID=UPI0022206152|nr:serine/threonine-protein phosphatase PP-X isozyme 2 [Radiomyces spectabilis]KAI8379090.1 serine/threonine-protein phosphatase PP-X isozyme 2 [Radiomyces spectabilis]